MVNPKLPFRLCHLFSYKHGASGRRRVPPSAAPSAYLYLMTMCISQSAYVWPENGCRERFLIGNLRVTCRCCCYTSTLIFLQATFQSSVEHLAAHAGDYVLCCLLACVFYHTQCILLHALSVIHILLHALSGCMFSVFYWLGLHTTGAENRRRPCTLHCSCDG